MRLVIVFDVDNTLTPPRQTLRPGMAEALCRLPFPFHLAAGSDLPLVQEQVLEPLREFGFRGPLDAFVCNGADRYRWRVEGGGVRIERISSFRLRDHLGEPAFNELCALLKRVLREPEFSLAGSGVTVRGPQVIDRGSMINFAPMGRPRSLGEQDYANRAAFVEFDRRTGYRQRLLAHLRRATEEWQRRYRLRITLGGQTSFDLVVEGYDKRYPLDTLLREGAESLLYFGDALHPGGNDSAVVEWIEGWKGGSECPVRAVAVRGWEDTLQQVESLASAGLAERILT